MPNHTKPPTRITLATLRQMRADKLPISMLTCYDHPTARILAQAGVEILLVGDSAATTILGHDSTVPIRLDFLITLTEAVRRGAPNVFLMADMPFGSYIEPVSATANALRFMQESRADCVKLECDSRHRDIVARMASVGIPVCAHLGLLPQRAGLLGGYKAQGRTPEELKRIQNDALELVQAGAALVLLEAVPDEVSLAVSEKLDVPVLGCGAGPSCDGHVVVIHDLLGYSEKPPRFVEVLADAPTLIRNAAEKYVESIRTRNYPARKHQYKMK